MFVGMSVTIPENKSISSSKAVGVCGLVYGDMEVAQSLGRATSSSHIKIHDFLWRRARDSKNL